VTEIHFAGRLTEADFRGINALAARKLWIGVGAIALVLIAGSIVAGGWALVWDSPATAFRMYLPFVLLGPVTVIAHRVTVGRHWRNNKILQQPVNGVVLDDAIVWNVEGISSARAPWNLLLRYRESASLVLVYQGPNQVFYFPMHYFASDSDWTAFRAIVRSKLSR
jgi:hypothetical protein